MEKETIKEEISVKKAIDPVSSKIAELKNYIRDNEGKIGNGTTARAILSEKKEFLQFLQDLRKS